MITDWLDKLPTDERDEFEIFLNSEIVPLEKVVRKLTDITRQDFETWNINRSLKIVNKYRDIKLSFEDLNHDRQLVWNMEQVYLNALIIEWLDMQGLQITTKPIKGGKFEVYVTNRDFQITVIDGIFKYRQEAIEVAINKANELYINKVSLMKTYRIYSGGDIKQTDVKFVADSVEVRHSENGYSLYFICYTIGNFSCGIGDETRVDEVDNETGEGVKVIK